MGELQHSDEVIEYIHNNFSVVNNKLYRRLFRGKPVEDYPVGEKLNSSGYGTVYCGTAILGIHVIIWLINFGNYSKGLEVDHIDRDKSNNNPENLRLTSSRGNKLNVGLKESNTSGYNGVYFNKCNKKWIAQASVLGEVKYIGSYETVIDASLARESFDKQTNGENT